MSSRLERFEAEAAIRGARNRKDPINANVPDLAVVKLRPKVDPAPKIDTSVPIVEPSDEAPLYFGDGSGKKDDDAPLVSSDEDSKNDPADDEAISDAEFDQAMGAMKVGNIEGGVQRLQQFAATHVRHPKADNALYFAGVGMMGLDQFENASKAFTQIVDEYPAGDATVDSMLKLAECKAKLNLTADAKALYARVVESYPGTPAANAAQSRLAALPRVAKEAP